MARKDVFLRLHSRLVVRRDALRKILADDPKSQHKFAAVNEVGDSIDAALDSANTEIGARFIEIETRELEHVERALRRIIDGVYGRCEYCGDKIAETRLNALPYTNSCIDCQRAIERDGQEYSSEVDENRWARVYEKPNLEESDRDSPIRLVDFEMDLS